AGKRDPLPLTTGQVGATLVRARQRRVERGELARVRRVERGEDLVRGRTARRDVVTQRQLVADEVLEDRSDARPPRRQIELAQLDAVDADRPRGRVVHA